MRHVGINRLLLLETGGQGRVPSRAMGIGDWWVLASPIAGAVQLVQEALLSCGGWDCVRSFPSCNLPAPAAATQHGGATTRAARCCQGTTSDAKLTLPGPLWAKLGGLGLERVNCWLAV